jgi:hypothetical protein
VVLPEKETRWLLDLFLRQAQPDDSSSPVKVCTHSIDCMLWRTLGAGFTQAALDHVEPFNTAATTPAPPSAGFSGPGPQPAYSDYNPSRPFNPAFRQSIISSSQPQYTRSAPSEGATPHVPGNPTAQPRTGKAALVARQHQSRQQPVQLEDSGARFDGNEEEAELECHNCQT